VQIVLTALANAPPDIAFQTVTDIAAWPKFVSAIEAIELMTPGAVGPGTRFRQTRVMFGRRATEEMKVAEMLPSRRLVLTAYNHGTAYRVEHAFAPEAAGTRMTLNFEGQPVTLVAWLLMPLGLLFMASVKQQLQSDFADLAREAERRHQQPGP
jgi:hypothetical protein